MNLGSRPNPPKSTLKGSNSSGVSCVGQSTSSLDGYRLAEMSKSIKNILVVVKQTPYEQYLQLKNQGIAPVALRWARLKNRYEIHRQCVEKTTDTLKGLGMNISTIGREEMHRGLLWDKDLVVCVGGDGTMLSTACFLDDEMPLLGINSDPTLPGELTVTNMKDERRSRGALCAASTIDIQEYLPRVILGDVQPKERARLQTIVKSTYTETRLPPALNDILVAHPSPAAVSRFRLTLQEMDDPAAYSPSFKPHAHTERNLSKKELYSFNCWSSGMWVSTATGSSAAMHAAGGYDMDPHAKDMQYMVREHLTEQGDMAQKDRGHGGVTYEQMLHLRWNSQQGAVFVDGSHTRHDLCLGDVISIEAHAPPVMVFDRD